MVFRILLAAFLAPLLYSQSTVVVEGIVLNHVTHQGISGVAVTLDRGTAGLAYRTITGADGAFHFADVDAGDYLPIFEKRGLSVVDASEKPLHFDLPGPIRLHAEMVSWTRISGRVLDAQGQPVAKIHVTLIPLREGKTSSGTVATTDDSGAYIIATQSGAFRLMASESPDDATPRKPAWAPTYYPAVTDPEAAQRITISAGNDLSGYEIHMQSAPLVKVRGTVLDTRGSPISGVPVKMVLPPAVWWDRDETEALSGEGGAFEFPAVRAGDWRVTAEVERGEGSLFGFAAVTVTNGDVSGVRVRLAEPFTVAGKVEGARSHGSSDLCESPGVSLISTEVDQEASSEVADDGSLRIPEVYPGRYRVQVCGVSSGSYLASVLVGDRDVLGQEFSLAAGATVRVVFKSDGGTVRGTVEQGDGRTVALIPADDALLDPMFVLTATAGAGGRFEIANVRPGEYRALAFDHVGDAAALADPSFVHDLATWATPVKVERNQAASIELKVVRWPE